jgi:hypothetical protein
MEPHPPNVSRTGHADYFAPAPPGRAGRRFPRAQPPRSRARLDERLIVSLEEASESEADQDWMLEIEGAQSIPPISTAQALEPPPRYYRLPSSKEGRLNADTRNSIVGRGAN